ncbi:hypothetical protein SNOG_11447 [Parastagonospora nodorum SN15]|uniref:Uncharacterized protein n=1 Tax=Phaeosphaeria nodorum (strain SN15 / ATCC MYA-4574 / FGSC 10173) TaxID=321614 RepID=Q0U9W7_PHANO|nr:hypothetical protein SNOG_11447 [Parastagonospora nodorum SN15]EAT81155.1 hypothetical protein SNOG_11447 [Parastagonospora nodorum SN15]
MCGANFYEIFNISEMEQLSPAQLELAEEDIDPMIRK